MSEGNPLDPHPISRNGMVANVWVVCPELARYRLPPTRLRYGRPADRYRSRVGRFLGRIWEGFAVTVTEWGGCCDPVVIEKLLDPCSGARVS
mgnify:CR=1 FL=1